MTPRLSRRRFLQAAPVALGTAAGFFSGRLSGEEKKPAPSDRVRVGVIGVGGQGEYNWGSVASAGGEIVALCDVDEGRAGGARKRFPGATFDADFRRLLDRKGIDAVVVATPDHTHAVATVAALKSGRHVYCEKPLTHDVYEARVVAETAAKAGKATQMGTQIHAGSNYRRVVELVRSGAVGPVREVHVWVGSSYSGGSLPAEAEPVPAGLHWDLWLGPAPERPYSKQYHPFQWRKWWDFGGGALADMACHYMDLPFWALGLRHPTRVHAEGPEPSPQTAPAAVTVGYEFPARGDRPPVKLTWYDGGRKPGLVTEGKAPNWGSGVLFVGEKGMLIADYGNRRLLPEKQYEGFKPPEQTIPDSVGHHKEWLQACRDGGTTTCNFDYAGALTEAVLLGVASFRSRQALDWDAPALRATNAPQAERFLRREYRKGWTL